MVEVGPGFVPEGRSTSNTDAVLWNDRAYQDMGDPRFKSRAQHREYMHARGLTVTSDYTQEWKKSEEQRVRFKQTGHDPSRKRDVIEAIHKLRK
jgi:hypothetical protein